MTNENNSFRITAHGDKATVWKISDYFYSVLYDSAKEPVAVKVDWVEKYLKDGDWVKENKLPEKFSFKAIGDEVEIIYSGVVKGDKVNVYWDNDKLEDTYYVSEAEKYVENGTWIIQEQDKFKAPVNISAEQSNTVLEQIKSFTTGTGHDVFVTEGIYKVYRAHEDMPYVAQNEEELIEIINALIVLDEAETE